MTADEVMIAGAVTHAPQSATATNTAGLWVPDHRVWFVCSNLLLASSGMIDVLGKGYAGAVVDNGVPPWTRGCGPGGGIRSDSPSAASGGGGYGGQGSWTGGGLPYGDPAAPVDPGSGGGDSWGTVGGAGGGVVRIEAANQVTVYGTINANGTKTSISGGSGGGVYITCNTFAGTNGLISADGGGGNTSGHQANGGGGRIAVVYDPPAQSNLNVTARPSVRFSANRGVASGGRMGRPGTLYFPDASFFPSTNLLGGEIVIPGFTAWSPASLSIGGSGLVVLTNGFRLSVTNDLTIASSVSGLELTNGHLSVGGNLKVDAGTLSMLSAPDNVSTVVVAGVFAVTNGAGIWIYSGVTNGAAPDYGALVVVSNQMRVSASSWVYPYSHGTNGGSVKFMLANLDVASGGGFDANGAGFWGGDPNGNPAPGFGPGKGTRGNFSSGGGYGGFGGGVEGLRGATNGYLMFPLHPGSGGSGGWGGNWGNARAGGGLIRLHVARTAAINGTLRANGNAQISGGSGGAIFLECQTLAGAGAILQANGGNGGAASHQSGGGGGRIAIWRIPELQTATTNTWTLQALGATAYWAGSNGTVYVGDRQLPWPLIENQPVGLVTTNSAQANGFLTSTGMAAAVVSVLWCPTDASTNLNQWAYTNTFAGTYGPQAFSTNLSIPVPGLYFYRYMAANSHGDGLASTSEVFLAGEVTIEATDPDASEEGPDTGAFTIRRPAGMTHAPTVVAYAVTGTASNGVDYTLLPGTVTIPAGATEAVVTVTPIFDMDTEPAETVTLTLLPGPYVVGDANEATVSIANLAFTPGLNVTVSNGNWTAMTIWSLGRPPVDGDDVVISGAVTISQSSASLKSLSHTGTLTFSGTNTVLTAGEMDIRGLVTHAANTDNQAPWVADGRVWLVCSNLVLATNGIINVDGKGYASAPGADTYAAGYGPGGGVRYALCSGGGGYGGGGARESANTNGVTYGSADQPFEPGSGGGVGWGSAGGSGGGVVRIAASNRVVLNGTVSANGSSTSSSGGSGGAIWITCRSLAATNGVLSANGGNGPDATFGAGGGGGRIAVAYDAAAQALLNQVAKPVLTVSANQGSSGSVHADVRSRPGTLWFTDSGFIPRTVMQGGQLDIPTFSAWSPVSLSISEGELILPHGFQLAVATHLTVTGGTAGLTLSNSMVTVGGALTVNAGRLTAWAAMTNAASLFVGGNMSITNGGGARFYASPTNGSVAYGALVEVGGDLVAAPGSWIYPHANPTNGGSVWFRVRNLTLLPGGGFNADGLGFGGTITANGEYDRAFGPGGGMRISEQTGGGGYGGLGGGAAPRGGAVYGSAKTPLLPGSGGGGGWAAVGGAGGGLILVEAAETATLNGTLSANGASTVSGGSGGAIYLRCRRLAGTTGVLSAAGGNGNNASHGAGGGGGRIAIHCASSLATTNTWTLSVAGGGYVTQGTLGQAGTVYFSVIPSGSLIILR